jgi:Lipid A 3-O-deacylase (PagL).
MTAGYDYGLKFIRLNPDYNLIDFGLGANIILAYGQKNDPSRERPDYTRIVPGFEANWNIRLYLLPIKKINTRIYLEGMGITFVYYTKPFPDNGTRINIGSHVGLGMDYRINSELRGFASLRLMHTSNGKEYIRNPAINAIGITTGLQF